MLAYDEVWLREPGLMVPGRSPNGRIKPDYTHPINNGLVCWFPLLVDFRDIGPRKLIQTSTNLPDHKTTSRTQGYDWEMTNSDRVTIPPVNSTEAITVSMWIYCKDHDGKVIAAKRTESNYSWEIGMRDDPNNTLTFAINSNTYRAIGNVVPENEWHFICGTFDRQNVRAYQNGVETATPEALADAVTSSSEYIDIGRRNYDTAYGYYDGFIYDFRIHSRALSPTEIADMYLDQWAGAIPA